MIVDYHTMRITFMELALRWRTERVTRDHCSILRRTRSGLVMVTGSAGVTRSLRCIMHDAVRAAMQRRGVSRVARA